MFSYRFVTHVNTIKAWLHDWFVFLVYLLLFLSSKFLLGSLFYFIWV